MVQEAGWVLVYGVAQEVEADIVLGLLQEEGIPALKRYPGAGQFLKLAYGLTSGVDIYVPVSQAARAKLLLAGGIKENGFPEDGPAEKGNPKSGVAARGFAENELAEQELSERELPKNGLPLHGPAKSVVRRRQTPASLPPASRDARQRDERWKWAILGIAAFLALVLLVYRNGFLW
ncbi:putative signal transducing protein [Acididesulfobacillus acetoxydans]|nr:DUF2007 domain-containing protein [Acididesulfobacillus acetoxydans]